MSELSNSDAELVYRYLNDRVRADVEYEAHSKALNYWRDDRPDDLDRLEAASDDPDSAFDWEIWFETSPDHGGDLVPLAGVEHNAEPEVYDLAHDFGWDYLNAVREEIRTHQVSTNFSPREFVALVLSESQLTYDEAAREMDVSSGTFASKMSREVTPEIEAAEETVQLVDQLRN
jgi:DNA-directed RNA polymerase specialized sigma24 family protein